MGSVLASSRLSVRIVGAMNDDPIELRRNGDTLTTDRARLPVDAALALLRTTNWASSMPREKLERAMEESLSFGVLRGGKLVAFARVVTDRATYAYLTDVVEAEELRGQGLGRWMMDGILAHPDLQDLRRFALLTEDAASLYEEFGFTVGAGGLTYMELKKAPTHDEA